ncbi:hypothetical protein AB5I41_22805 [Sphingomonas sp. MMS24-JH45]
MPLARAVASRYKRWRWQGADRRNLEQLAFEGLLQALDRFDPLVGIPLRRVRAAPDDRGDRRRHDAG